MLFCRLQIIAWKQHCDRIQKALQTGTCDSSDNNSPDNSSHRPPVCIAIEELLIEKTKHLAICAVTASTPPLPATSSAPPTTSHPPSAPPTTSHPPSAPPTTSHLSDAICHAVYTSGSTGLPKCVLVQHSAMVAFVSAWRAAMRISKTSRVFMASAHTFDPSLSDMWTVRASSPRRF